MDSFKDLRFLTIFSQEYGLITNDTKKMLTTLQKAIIDKINTGANVFITGPGKPNDEERRICKVYMDRI